MKCKNERKMSRPPRNGKKPAAVPAPKTTKPKSKPRRTIKQVIIETITANSAATSNEMIAAVKAEFPKSAFDGQHAAWYRSQARKGLLTGSPITIAPTGKEQPKGAE